MYTFLEDVGSVMNCVLAPYFLHLKIYLVHHVIPIKRLHCLLPKNFPKITNARILNTKDHLTQPFYWYSSLTI